jgi:hypothetical protein
MRAFLGGGLILVLAMGSGVAYMRARAGHNHATFATGGPTTIAQSARSSQEPDSAVNEVTESEAIGPDCNTNLQ